jgi:antitoxin StbD
MTRLLTTEIAPITELHKPQKVLARANGKPVAILKNSKRVSYLVPIEAVSDPAQHRHATMVEVMESMERTRAQTQPVLDYLEDK